MSTMGAEMGSMINGEPIYDTLCPICGEWVFDLIATDIEDGCGNRMSMCVKCKNRIKYGRE